MDFNGGGLLNNNINNNIHQQQHHDHDHDQEDDEDQLDHNHLLMAEDLRRGPWTVEEDVTLINYISIHGEGRWNSLATCAGLKRTGKSCRLRWLNYLRPDVRRGNITLEEQLLILELHSRWGNRWSKIAQHLPGRTDNEIKNYWRTRVQKHAKQLKCDVNSKQFKDTMRYLWMPRLLERINVNAAAASTTTTTTTIADLGGISSSQLGGGGGHHQVDNNNNNNNNILHQHHQYVAEKIMSCSSNPTTYAHGGHVVEQHSMGSSSDSFTGAQVVSPASSSDNNNNNFQVNNNYDGTTTTTTTTTSNYLDEYYCYQQVGNYTDMLISPSGYYNINNLMHGFDHFQPINNNNNINNQWSGDFGDVLLSENLNLWNVDHQVDISFLQQQFNNMQ